MRPTAPRHITCRLSWLAGYSWPLGQGGSSGFVHSLTAVLMVALLGSGVAVVMPGVTKSSVAGATEPPSAISLVGSSTSVSGVVAPPTGMQDDDILIAHLMSTAVPAGFTELVSTVGLDSEMYRPQSLSYRFVNGPESALYDFGVPAALVAYRGIDKVSVTDAIALPAGTPYGENDYTRFPAITTVTSDT